MVRKRCTRCKKMSYSLSEKGFWFCPSCGADLTAVPVQARDRSTAGVLPVTVEEANGCMLN